MVCCDSSDADVPRVDSFWRSLRAYREGWAFLGGEAAAAPATGADGGDVLSVDMFD